MATPASRLIDWLLGGPAPAALPARVADTIRAQQRRSEILTSLVQLAVVLGFGTLYLSVPMAQGQVQMLAIVPSVLSIYIGFTLLRLLLAWRDWLPDWLLYLSSIVDMALLVVTIWSFHLQYAQPATFYLKAPTQLYFFIFIALRALRFEARFVVVAGIAAACGWAALTLFVLSGTGGDPNVTRDFVVYMTSNATLIGAEVDRIVAMLTVTAILALAIARARRLLVRSVAERQAARDLAQFFDPGVASQITGADASLRPGHGEARDATILVVDIRGFTRLSTRLGPDDVVRLLEDYHARLCPIIQAHGGAIDKFLGDGILASFGAVARSATHAADALRATEALLAAGDAWSRERQTAGLASIAIGLAAASGSVLFGVIGDGTRLEYTVIGDAVNRAAKLETHNKIEGSAALTDAATMELARAQGYDGQRQARLLPARSVAGIGEPIDLVALA
ncbi:MAG: adenylate/guanylate cyclase domain-containing protein [Reyranellaceae bacterium]